jgi:hypothetical protein
MTDEPVLFGSAIGTMTDEPVLIGSAIGTMTDESVLFEPAVFIQLPMFVFGFGFNSGKNADVHSARLMVNDAEFPRELQN